MLIGCPKCKTRLNIPDEKIAPQGSKFKCPKCGTILMVRPPAAKAAAPQPAAPTKPAAAPPPPPPSPPQPKAAPAPPPQGEFKQTVEAQAKEINPKKILVAHEDSRVVEGIMLQLLKDGYLIIPASNGIDAQNQIMKELPFLVLLDAALPRVTGFELIKRVKGTAQGAGIKGVILTSTEDPARSPQGPPTEFGALGYLDIANIETGLANIMSHALGAGGQAPKAAPQPAAAPAPPKPAVAPPPQPQPKPAAAPAAAPAMAAAGAPKDKEVEKARRLARTVLGDIDLYSPDKVLDAVKNGQFEAVFAEELREGLKHYQNRIPQEVRNKGNFFQEAIDAFTAKKKQALGM